MKTTRYYMVEAEVCGTCIHYHQHYVLSMGQIFSPLWYGHCGRRGMRHPQPDDVCPHFTKLEKEPASKDWPAPPCAVYSMAIRLVSGTAGIALGRFSSRIPFL